MKHLLNRRWLRSLVLVLLLAPTPGFALICRTQGSGEVAIRDQLSSTVAIPASVANGEVVWRSEPLDIQVECVKDVQPLVQEEVMLSLNPDNVAIGQGIRAGLTLNGVDYVQGGGRIGTGHYLPVCHEEEANLVDCPVVRFNLAFSVFIQKFGSTPPSGVASDLPEYRFFELDSSVARQSEPGRSLSYVIDNLNGLRFVACDAELQVLPQTVEFGEVPIQEVVIGKVFAKKPFALVTSRTCDSPFSINARFRPVSGTVSEAGGLLVPAANDSLGIRITSAVNGESLRYNEPFHLSDLLGETHSAQADFDAELVWNSARPRVGPFDAEIMVDLFYK